MNIRPIKGNENLSVLLQAAEGIGGSSVEDLERECTYLQAGVKAAKGKISNAVDKQKAAKYLLKRRSTLPENVVRLAIISKRDAAEAEKNASYERDKFLQQYRNFRNLIYIARSIQQIGNK